MISVWAGLGKALYWSVGAAACIVGCMFVGASALTSCASGVASVTCEESIDDDPRRVENVVRNDVLVRQPRARYQKQPLPLGHRCARRSHDPMIVQEARERGIAPRERRARRGAPRGGGPRPRRRYRLILDVAFRSVAEWRRALDRQVVRFHPR